MPNTTMGEMARDYYADGHEIAERLVERGHREWSERITEAIESGSTGNEILMALRWQLGNLMGADLGLDEDTRALAESLHADLDTVLR